MLDSPRLEQKLMGFSLQSAQVSNHIYLPENISLARVFKKARKGAISEEAEVTRQFHMRKALASVPSSGLGSFSFASLSRLAPLP